MKRKKSRLDGGKTEGWKRKSRRRKKRIRWKRRRRRKRMRKRKIRRRKNMRRKRSKLDGRSQKDGRGGGGIGGRRRWRAKLNRGKAEGWWRMRGEIGVRRHRS